MRNAMDRRKPTAPTQIMDDSKFVVSIAINAPTIMKSKSIPSISIILELPHYKYQEQQPAQDPSKVHGELSGVGPTQGLDEVEYYLGADIVCVEKFFLCGRIDGFKQGHILDGAV